MDIIERVRKARPKLELLRDVLYSAVPGRREMVDGILLSLVAGEHALVLGPPGTAKSYTVSTLTSLIGAQSYIYQLTKFTTYDDLFGPPDLVELQRGSYKRAWSKIVNSHIVYLDEVFNANSAILNALLSLMQERVVYDPVSGTPVQTAVHMVVATSNDVPLDKELQAFVDRFAVKIHTDYISNYDEFLKAVEARWATRVKQVKVVTIDEIKALSHALSELAVARVADLGRELYREYADAVWPLAQSLRKAGVLLSDRWLVEKGYKLFLAYLAVNGISKENIDLAPYELARYTAATPDERKEVERVVKEALGEAAELEKKLENVKRLYSAGKYDEARKALADLIASVDINKLSKNPAARSKVEKIASEARQMMGGGLSL
ncbi:MAG: AAA family ATPase [Thermofilaceae archaeon]